MADFDRPGYDDYDDERSRLQPEAVYPGMMIAAGVIYIICGGLFLLNIVASCVLQGAMGGADPGGNLCGIILSFVLGIPYLLAGLSHVRKTIFDPMGYAIMALIIGGIYALLGVLVIVVFGKQLADPALGVILGGIVFGFAMLLALPGILGLWARKRFLVWRREQMRHRLSNHDERSDYDDLSRPYSPRFGAEEEPPPNEFDFDDPRNRRPRRGEDQ